MPSELDKLKQIATKPDALNEQVPLDPPKPSKPVKPKYTGLDSITIWTAFAMGVAAGVYFF